MIAAADKLDIVWLAGLLEGEGCFDLHRGKYPRVRLVMTDRDIVGKVADLFGCTLRLTELPPPKSPTFHAEIQGAVAIDVMRAVLPHMGARRSSKIASILSAHKARTLGVGWRGSASSVQLTRPPLLASV